MHANFKEMRDSLTCTFCGWKGELATQPRVWLTQESIKEIARESAQKKAGKLFFVRIQVASDDVCMQVMMILNASSCMNKQGSLLIRVERRPSTKTLNELRKIKGIKKVEIF